MKMNLFGVFDRVLVGIILSLSYLIIYGKLLSDFAQFYVTGHTTHFIWFAGDLGATNGPGAYSLEGFIFVVIVGWANMIIWMRLFDIATKLVKKVLSKYEIR